MILVDTSVWVDHLRTGLPPLKAALEASDGEVLLLIEQEQLMGRGIGYVDAHLLASARLTRCWLWSRDRRLNALARDLGVAAPDCPP